MNYSFFLFNKLYDSIFGVDHELEYDLMFDNMLSLFNEYECSQYNDEFEPEYECMVRFLKQRLSEQK